MLMEANKPVFPDYDIVKIAALSLMQTNQTTTTLEVKDFLRRKGYSAYQRDISYLLDWIANQENWLFTYNGAYRTYRLNDLNEADLVPSGLFDFSEN